MSMELFANNFASTLNGAITSAATSLVLAAAVPSRLATAPGQWRIVVDGEIMLVTAVAGDNVTLTVTRGAEGSTAGAHASGAAVVHILTDQSLRAISVNPFVNDCRLSLSSTLPVTTADMSNAGTIYLLPYVGNRIALYDGSTWNTYVVPAAGENVAVSAASGAVVDVFASASSGNVALSLLAWTNSTTRATALTTQDGVLVLSTDATKRYLGTIYANALNSVSDTLLIRGLWNYYHRIGRPMLFQESAASWTYASATVRQADADANAKVQFVCGYAEDPVSVEVFCGVAPSGAAAGNVQIGIDSITIGSADAAIEVGGGSGTSGLIAPSFAVYNKNPGIGYHYAAWLEECRAGGCTFYGAFGNSQGSIRGTLLA